MDIGEMLVKSVTSATSKWTKYQKRRERTANAWQTYMRSTSSRVTLKDIAYEVMEQAYMAASAGGTLPVAARQIMYKARPLILARYDGQVDSQYFIQTLLVGYLAKHRDKTANWDVVFDARGHLHEPHTGRKLPLGTIAVREYLHHARNGRASNDNEVVPSLSSSFSTFGPKHRFNTVLFIEKEGFAPLLDHAQISERFDIAVMSTKGLSTTAARSLVDSLPGVRFLVLHDFDKSGFSILGTLQRSTDRYRFKSRPDVVDLGLRLSDVEEEKLESEPVALTKNPEHNLRLNGATTQEIRFLLEGQRVELNAFASDHFIDWLERKLTAAGVKKVVPDADTLAAAYRRAVFVNTINASITQAHEDAQQVASSATVPKTLRRSVEKILKDEPALSWDDALAQVASRRKADKK